MKFVSTEARVKGVASIFKREEGGRGGSSKSPKAVWSVINIMVRSL